MATHLRFDSKLRTLDTGSHMGMSKRIYFTKITLPLFEHASHIVQRQSYYVLGTKMCSIYGSQQSMEIGNCKSTN